MPLELLKITQLKLHRGFSCKLMKNCSDYTKRLAKNMLLMSKKGCGISKKNKLNTHLRIYHFFENASNNETRPLASTSRWNVSRT